MASTYNVSNLATSTAADAIYALLNGGTVSIYDGTQPATSNVAVTTQTRLATLTFGSPAFQPAVDGFVTANAIASANASMSGTATWFRCVTPGAQAIADGSVDMAGADMNLDTTAIQAGASVSVTSMVLQVKP